MTRRTSTLVTMAALALATCVVQAADDISNLPPGTVLEGSVETTTDQVVFPSSTSGQIMATPCPGCDPKSFPLSAETWFNLAGKRVTLQEMAAYCGRVRDKPINIQYRLRDSIVSMVSVGEL